MMPAETTRIVETRRESGAWKAKHGRILAAALDEFIDRGFNGASMDRIAAKAKVSKVTIYNHFENKDLLYRQMLDYYAANVHPGVPPVEFSPGLTPRDCKGLAAYLEAEVQAGRLTVPNADIAARQLIGMLLENTVYPSLMGSTTELTRHQIDEIVASCIATFLAHYSASA